MPRTYEHHSHPWTAVGVGLLVVLLLVWFAWRGSQEIGASLKFSLRDAAPSLPSLPQLPQGPTLPAAPIPSPK